MPSNPQRTIVVVGGVAGGASAAARARRINEHARIILLEKDEHVSFANCGLPYYIGGEITDRRKLLVAGPDRFQGWLNIDVRTRHEVLAIDRQGRSVRVLDRNSGAESQIAYDRLILAPGASPIVPDLPGIHAPNVFTLRNLADTDQIKTHLTDAQPRKAVVVGGGFIGLEMVEMLRRRGLEISLVELAPQVLPPLDPEMARMVEAELCRQGVQLHLHNGLTGLEVDKGLVRRVVLSDGTKLDADVVLLAIGVRPNTRLAREAGLELGASGGIRVNAFMQTSDPLVYAVGDAVEYVHGVADFHMRIPLAGPANRAGRVAGEHAAADASPPMPRVLGTAIVRVFDVVAGVTGCNSRCVAQIGGPAKAVWVPAHHHVSYYPGAQEMMLKLLYNPDSGQVLGAQIVGQAGVDKRLDVIATAIQLGATVDDLAGLDLAYAPPFGAAKDPVHLAAFAAQNERRGLDHFVAPEAAQGQPDPPQVLDVRTKGEWDAGHVDGAIWIPLHELRQRVEELDRHRPVLTVCRAGQRSYYASRILQQSGFSDVRTLSGGMLMQQYVRPAPAAAAAPPPRRAHESVRR